MKAVCLLLLLLCPPSFAETKSEIIQRMNKRYSDFFERLEREERRERERLSGVDEIKESRQKHQELIERARKRYVLNRKPPVDTSAAYQAYLEEQKKDLKKYLALQNKYAMTQREVEEALRQGKKIPEVLEYKLQDAL